MALVTDIVVPRRGTRERVIHVDHDEWRTTSSDVLKALELRIGHVEPLDDLDASIAAAEERLARERALRLLAYRERSAAELVRRLRDDGYPVEVADSTVGALVSTGLVDDERYARGLAHLLTEVRGLGRSRAERDLLSRGIDPVIAGEALDEVVPIEDELARALELAHALVQRTGPDIDRLAARLARKGYAPSIALRAARTAAEDAGGDGAGPEMP